MLPVVVTTKLVFNLFLDVFLIPELLYGTNYSTRH